MSEKCEYCGKLVEDCQCIEGINFHKCLYCEENQFKTGDGYDNKDYYCSEKCYEDAKQEGWME